MIKYTEEFKNRVREVYGNIYDNMLESGNAWLGRHLGDNSTNDISIDKVLLAANLESLQKEARIIKKKRNLYTDYWEQPGIKTT